MAIAAQQHVENKMTAKFCKFIKSYVSYPSHNTLHVLTLGAVTQGTFTAENDPFTMETAFSGCGDISQEKLSPGKFPWIRQKRSNEAPMTLNVGS